MTQSLKERLDAIARSGSLSTADLAHWFTLSYATMKSYRGGVEPYAARRTQIDQRLNWLETAVKNSPLLPVPMMIKAADRAAYIALIRRDYETAP